MGSKVQPEKLITLAGGSLAAAPSGFGQLSVAPHEENRRAELNMLLKELQANSETVSCNIERLIEDYNMRGCNGIVANCGHREIHVVVKVGLNGHTKLGVSANDIDFCELE